MTAQQFCDTNCKICPYEDCEISHDPSCKRSRELKVKLEPEE